ncbi:hypothetical protein GCM10022248_88960 [Nonomuraea soli]
MCAGRHKLLAASSTGIVRPHVAYEGTLLIIDNREAPSEIRELAAHRAVEAVAAYLS